MNPKGNRRPIASCSCGNAIKSNLKRAIREKDQLDGVGIGGAEFCNTVPCDRKLITFTLGKYTAAGRRIKIDKIGRYFGQLTKKIVIVIMTVGVDIGAETDNAIRTYVDIGPGYAKKN